MSENHNDLVVELKTATDALNAQKTAFEELKSTNDELRAKIEEKGSADTLIETKLDKISEDMAKQQDILDQFQLAQKRQSRVHVDADGNEIDFD